MSNNTITQSQSKDIHNSTKIYKANGATPSAASNQAMLTSAVAVRNQAKTNIPLYPNITPLLRAAMSSWRKRTKEKAQKQIYNKPHNDQDADTKVQVDVGVKIITTLYVSKTTTKCRYSE